MRRLGRILGTAERRVPVEAAARLDLEHHASELMLDRLELRDRHAERLARLGIVARHLDAAHRPAERVGGEQRQRRVAHARGCRDAVRQRL